MDMSPYILHLGSADRNKSPTDNTDLFILNTYGMNNTDCRLIGEYLTDAVLNTDVFSEHEFHELHECCFEH